MSPLVPPTGPENNNPETPATSPIHRLTEAIIAVENQLRNLKEGEPLPINFVICLGAACFLFRSRMTVTQALGQDQNALGELKGRLEAIYKDPTFTKIREAHGTQAPGVDRDYQFIIGFFEGKN
ncbi:hypothetical protein JW752_04550 [Candidatus Peregrinibacteria bacterium]|nr:hypothetical protein [Candidatus Peregrinibacteria bacterium]